VRASRRTVTFGAFLVTGLVVALVIAMLVSPHASTSPDGLEKVAQDQGFAQQERPHALERAPTAGYQVRGVDDHGISTGVAGAIGVVVTFVLVSGLLLAARRARQGKRARPQPVTTAAPGAP
jgi:uncharacterized iron-regulated membrane protein